VFVLFTLLAILRWGIRWHGLAILLFIWGVLGAWTLIKKKVDTNEFKTRSVIRRAIRTVVLIFLVIIPAFIFPQYRLPKVTGGYKVATINHTYTDKSRLDTYSKTGGNRTVNVEFWYPKDAGGKYPLVVFDHGSDAMKISNTSTFINLASNGYVVCSIDHPHQSLFTIDDKRHLTIVDQATLMEIVDANAGKYDEATEVKLEQKWMLGRTVDINFVLDTILTLAKESGTDDVYQLIDTGEIGLMGHSLGGAASAQVARERNDISAVVNLDADLLGEYVDYAGGKRVLNATVYPVPILTIFADDMVRLIDAIPDANTVVAVKHVGATAPNAYEVHIKGTDHQSLTDLPLVSPFLVYIITSTVKKAGGGELADKNYVIDQMNDLVLGFFNYYLKSEGNFTPAKTY
jgi:dienelactone hydrolase